MILRFTHSDAVVVLVRRRAVVWLAALAGAAVPARSQLPPRWPSPPAWLVAVVYRVGRLEVWPGRTGLSFTGDAVVVSVQRWAIPRLAAPDRCGSGIAGG